jgi:hypothetical protein
MATKLLYMTNPTERRFVGESIKIVFVSVIVSQPLKMIQDTPLPFFFQAVYF